MFLITEKDLHIYKYLDNLKNEAELKGEKEEANLYKRKMKEVEDFIEGIKEKNNPIYQDIYVALKYRYIYGFKIHEVSNKMNCSESTTKRYLKKGRKLLKVDTK